MKNFFEQFSRGAASRKQPNQNDRKASKRKGIMSEEKKNPEENEIIEGEIIEEAPEAAAAAAAVDEEATGSMESAASVEAYNKLTQELQQAQDQAKSFFDGWQRERADFANYKRRVDRDQQMMSQNITGEVVKKYLTVLDDLDRALKTRPTEGPAAAWSNGIELIQRKLQNILDAEGVKRMPAEKEQFNPARHEAISYEESPDHESGQIIEVVQQGYTIGDRVLRPALVRVAR
jgi:molecular chaperone GrpE